LDNPGKDGGKKIALRSDASEQLSSKAHSNTTKPQLRLFLFSNPLPIFYGTDQSSQKTEEHGHLEIAE